MNVEKINFSEKFGKLPDGDYAVGLIAKMNNYDFKIVKFKGDFVWHRGLDRTGGSHSLDSAGQRERWPTKIWPNSNNRTGEETWM